MNVIYITANVLGDSGANAAEIFPAQASRNPYIERSIVADYAGNRQFIVEKQSSEFLRLRSHGSLPYVTLGNALRVARKSIEADVQIIHVFYRQSNLPLLILIRLILLLLRGRARIVLDHRSVNLTKGWRYVTKLLLNQSAQPFTHALAGNPFAVKTNYFFIHKKSYILDLGYDGDFTHGAISQSRTVGNHIWYVGSIKPRNRNSQFMLDIFESLANQYPIETPFQIHVAGPTSLEQEEILNNNHLVIYHGTLPRKCLYDLMWRNPGLGLAFMDKKFHQFAASLKFAEYALFNFYIVASNTVGLKTQHSRMGYENVCFCDQSVGEWVETIASLFAKRPELKEVWRDKNKWSYRDIFESQVVKLYYEQMR